VKDDLVVFRKKAPGEKKLEHLPRKRNTVLEGKKEETPGAESEEKEEANSTK